ncbi:hypothetical protein AB0H29_03410 [Streptomyces thermolilacinus]
MLIPKPGAPTTGLELHAVNSHLQRFAVPTAVRPRHVYRSEDIALLIVDWAIDGTGREGQAVHVEGAAYRLRPARSGQALPIRHR